MKRLFGKKIIYVLACIMLACIIFFACAKIETAIEKNTKNDTPVPTVEADITALPLKATAASLETPEPTEKPTEKPVEKPIEPTAVPASAEPAETTAPNQFVTQAETIVSSVSPTQNVTQKTTPSPTPKRTPVNTHDSTPKSTENSGSDVQIIVVTPTPIVSETHIAGTPAPSAAPVGGISKDKCSMIDYTKQALPSEQYKNEITTILSKVATGYGTSFSLSTQPDITSFLYSHRYLIGTIRLTMIGYKNPSSYTIEASFKQAESKVQYLATLAWGDFVIGELGINKNTLQKDAIAKINEYLADFLKYDYDSFNKYLAGEGYNVDENVYVSIQTGIGVCEHYAQLFQLLCHKCGISAYYEANSTRFHAYNYVLFSDGAKYYVDATWNDSIETTKFNINGVQYADVYAAADGIWGDLPSSTFKRFSSGLQCDKQGFIDYYCNFYLSRYLLLTRDAFIDIHRDWSAGDHYYNYEVHED